MPSGRGEFLIEMYRQCSAHLDRHILIPWQSIGVIGAALAVFLVEGKLDAVSDLDFLLTLAVVLCFWLAANLYDANNWFDRNLHIIANVERQFLNSSDLREIHPFFGEHRWGQLGRLKLLRHFRIQLTMTIAVLALVLAFHLARRVLVDGCLPSGWTWGLPYVALVVGLICVFDIRERTFDETRKLIALSPGKELSEKGPA
jgi:hypothetical protein